MKPESFYSPFFELFSFWRPSLYAGQSKSGSEFFLGTGFRKFPTYHLLKILIRWLLLCIVHSFFLCFFLFLSTNIFLFASQFYGNSFVDFGTCCYTYNPSIVAVDKSSIAAVLFSPTSKRFICLFFLLPHKAASHTGDFYRTLFQESLSRAACLPASLELSRDFYRENFGVVKSIYSTLSSFFFTFCFIIGWFLATFSLPLPFPPSSRSVQHFFGHFFRDF